ncbi:MAG: 30S ribosomal protein S4 [Microgenomates group bacterium ADurb.Bin219]|nr:MAG: 30S ribosomal protein S4 [Microgenomates group bacterium ADurb.Bin219]
MSRYLGPKCRLCRREGKKLFLKGARCSSPKCPLEKKGAVIPGQHGSRRFSGKSSEYSLQLREKQKAKRTYQVFEKQIKIYYEEAKKQKSATGKALLRLLETRLDNVLYRLGFSASRSSARQLIRHGHVTVDGKKVNIPSFLVKKDQLIGLDQKALKIVEVKKAVEDKDYKLPLWLERKAAVGKIIRLPDNDDLPTEIDDQLIVEFYSRA